MNKIFWAGDSTVQTNDYSTFPQTGIGQVFPIFLKEGYQVENHAKNGRSTKSFLDEGRFKAIEQRIDEGDFLFIQFGHNDEKKEDPARYTDPASSYRENLQLFVETARSRKAYPVLITPLERRCFEDGGELGQGAHGEYVAAMKQAARDWDVALVDLHGMSRTALQEAQELKSRSWYMYFEQGEYDEHPEESRDNTHLRYAGAVKFAGMIARGLQELGGIYGEMIIDMKIQNN